jgi:uncharacterized protein
MRSSALIVASAVLAGLFAAGTAHADVTMPAKTYSAGALASVRTGTASAPALPAALLRNAIYDVGDAAALRCSPPSTRKGSAASIKRYLLQVSHCVERMWRPLFKESGMTFTRPKLVIMTSGAKSPCGKFTPASTAHYCPSLQTIYFRLMKSQIKQPFELVLAKTMAHEYGHHVQRRTGIFMSAWGIYTKAARPRARVALMRRLEQQAECFAGVFLSAVRTSLPVNSYEYDYVLKWARENATDRDHGKGTNQAWWLNRGFAGASPGSCNTWAAAAARVS